MMKIIVLSAICLAGADALAADLHRCTQANGQISYQDRPCASRARGAQPKDDSKADERLNAPGFTVYSPAAPSPKPAGNTAAADRISEQNQRIDAQNKQIEAANRAKKCLWSQNELGQLSEERPLYHYDSKGERQYLDDDTRTKRIAAARQAVSRRTANSGRSYRRQDARRASQPW